MNKLKKIRRENLKKRKNFLPTLILTIILIALTVSFIYFVDPTTNLALPVFFMLVFFSSLFLLSIIFGNSGRGLVMALGLTIFLILRYFGVGNILNFLLISGVVIAAELYFDF